MELLEKTIKEISALNQTTMTAAQERLDSLTKPPGSLGKLEELAIKLAGMTEEVMVDVSNKAHIIMVGDHGVVEEGVSAFPQQITGQMVQNFLQGGAAINVLSKQVGAQVEVVDIGMVAEINNEDLIVKKIKSGTDNIAFGPAMTRKEAISSLEVGIKVVEEMIAAGVQLIGTGEMGIGNTTPSSAILAASTDLSLEQIVGYGTGIDEAGLEKKKEVIAQALEVNQPQTNDGLDILAKVGGLEIGGMAGVMLGAAAQRVPVIIDGLISGAAALIAHKIEPQVSNYLLPSHQSVEPGHAKIYEVLDLEALLDLEMRLGEGTGAVLSMNLVEAAANIINEMATFSEAGIPAEN